MWVKADKATGCLASHLLSSLWFQLPVRPVTLPALKDTLFLSNRCLIYVKVTLNRFLLLVTKQFLTKVTTISFGQLWPMKVISASRFSFSQEREQLLSPNHTGDSGQLQLTSRRSPTNGFFIIMFHCSKGQSHLAGQF